MSLLALPQELQDKIWTYVCGNSMVHVSTSNIRFLTKDVGAKRYKLATIRILHHTHSDEDRRLHGLMCTYPPGQASYPWLNQDNGRARIETSHAVCELSNFVHGFDGPVSVVEYISLHMTCKAMFDSALRVLYETNVFSFNGTTAKPVAHVTVPEFCATLPLGAHFWLRKLHLRTLLRTTHDHTYDLDWLWADGRLKWIFDEQNTAGVKRLAALQELSIEFVCLPSGSREKGLNLFTHVGKVFGGVKRLGLRELHVTCWKGRLVDSKPQVTPWYMNRKYWEMGGQIGLERKLRARLLGLSEDPLRTENELDLLRFEEEERLSDLETSWFVLERESAFSKLHA